MSKTIEELMFCTHCRAKLGVSHHEPHCIHWGQVLPSECKGLIDAIILKLYNDGKLHEEKDKTD